MWKSTSTCRSWLQSPKWKDELDFEFGIADFEFQFLITHLSTFKQFRKSNFEVRNITYYEP